MRSLGNKAADGTYLDGVSTPASRQHVGQELICLLPRLRRYGLVLCKSAAAADDLVQSACLKALASAEKWTLGTRFDAWAFRIMRNHWIDQLRKDAWEVPLDPEASEGVMVQDGETRVMARFELEDVRQAIEKLSHEQQEVLLLICGDEMSYREASEILNVPIGTVMSRLARARQQLLRLTGTD
ncbi:RNA polymerase sigma-70 factor (ECF subfamily) [Rhodoligotrophos appendicifer]|uniref:RNA polymerase sigma factor n=1 Tax=Rhodoligotrophos appendicifer TaxID=987056 RepID=UPI0011870E56|nr:RNA polymerase sigma factor [Rhodoligotrophos appendicifer]